ncbi:MAG: Gfo/Idh/MocA family oxidoreductase [Clostridiales bacterium]|nr:Gfo/Idh/MocA family oxidoreductase [Clostridiales bacterium]
MNMIGVCLIGAGRAGMIHARNFAGRVPGARMAAVADPVQAARDAAMAELNVERGYADYRDALADPSVDAVVIVSPTKYHREIALAAAAAGKHILCEKPMAMDEAECDDMIAAAEKYGVKLQIGFMRRYDASYLRAKQMIDDGAIGDVVLVKSHTRGPSVPQPWMYDIRVSNGPLAEVNSHDIDSSRWFAGSELKRLFAVGGNYRSPDAREKYPDFYDNVALTGVFENGVQCMIDGSQGVGYGYDAHTEIVGTKGVLRVGRDAEQFVTCATAGALTTPFVSSWRTLFRDAYLEEDVQFAECIRTGEAPRVTGLDGKMAVRVVKAGNRSIAEGRIVELSEVGLA